MSTESAIKETVPYGWCLSGEHDTPDGRGSCPIQVGTQSPCSCRCHKGATDARGFKDSSAQVVSLPWPPKSPSGDVLEEVPEENGQIPLI